MEKIQRTLIVTYLLGLLILFVLIWFNLFPEDSIIYKNLAQVHFALRYLVAGILTSALFWMSYLILENLFPQHELDEI